MESWFKSPARLSLYCCILGWEGPQTPPRVSLLRAHPRPWALGHGHPQLWAVALGPHGPLREEFPPHLTQISSHPTPQWKYRRPLHRPGPTPTAPTSPRRTRRRTWALATVSRAAQREQRGAGSSARSTARASLGLPSPRGAGGNSKPRGATPLRGRFRTHVRREHLSTFPAPTGGAPFPAGTAQGRQAGSAARGRPREGGRSSGALRAGRGAGTGRGAAGPGGGRSGSRGVRSQGAARRSPRRRSSPPAGCPARRSACIWSATQHRAQPPPRARRPALRPPPAPCGRARPAAPGRAPPPSVRRSVRSPGARTLPATRPSRTMPSLKSVMAGPRRARAQRLGAREREPLPRAAASRTPGEGGGAPHHLPPAARRPMAARALAASLLLRCRRGQWQGGAARSHVGKEGGRKMEGGARGRGFGRGRGRGEGGAGGDVTFAGSFVPPALAGGEGAGRRGSGPEPGGALRYTRSHQ